MMDINVKSKIENGLNGKYALSKIQNGPQWYWYSIKSSLQYWILMAPNIENDSMMDIKNYIKNKYQKYGIKNWKWSPFLYHSKLKSIFDKHL